MTTPEPPTPNMRPPPHPIILNVSGRKYRTHSATLQTSPCFQNLLARWPSCSDRQADGSYFIDADPAVFEHVLQFMRRPSQFPLFWTKATGLDYALYTKLEAEADYFLLHDLRDWIRTKRYLGAVKTVTDVEVLAEDALREGRKNQTTGCAADSEVQSFFGSYSGVKKFRNACADHKDEVVSRCDDCEELMRAFGPHYDDAPKRLTVVTTRTEFDETVCVNDMN